MFRNRRFYREEEKMGMGAGHKQSIEVKLTR